MSIYSILADVLVALHVAYVAYVVLGQVAIVIGAAFHRQWARNPWFRFTHLLAITIVAVEALMGWPCPLTIWEQQLRMLAGQENVLSSESFMGRLLRDILFVENMPRGFFITLYAATLLLVLQALIMYPPRWFRFRRPVPVDSDG